MYKWRVLSENMAAMIVSVDLVPESTLSTSHNTHSGLGNAVMMKCTDTSPSDLDKTFNECASKKR